MTAHLNKGLPGVGARSPAAVREVVAGFQRSVIELACQISAIAAPTNHERERSRFVAEEMTTLLPKDVVVDDLGDVVGRIPGKQKRPSLLLAAHLDTVFPAGTALDVVRSNGRIVGPGIGDNSLGVASVLMVPKVLEALGVVPEVDILLTGNVGEEGLGNLRGIRSVMDLYPEIGAVIAVEGHNLGRVTHVAVGSRRLRVRVSGPGGHSWGDFGNASAIHAAAEIITELSRLTLPTTPKTTLNVGTFTGGISVNTIAPEASFVIDLRSVDEGALRRLSERVDSILRSPRPNIRIVRLAIETLEAMGISPTGDASSTDANIPISRGIPAVCIGLTTGGNVHREDEFIDVAPIVNGLTQLVLLSLAVTAELGAGSIAPIGGKKRAS
jgi:tripeptide aminopeptidase